MAMAQPQVLGRVVMLERIPHVSRHCLKGTSMSLLKMAKSGHFQMFHSPDYLPQNLRTQKLGLLERNKQDLFNLFLVVYSLSGSLEMFHNGESWKWNCWWFHRPHMQHLFSGPFQKVIGCEGTRYTMQWSIW